MSRRIKKNFLVVSNYFNDISWVPAYTDNYLIYDQSGDITLPSTIDHKKVIKSPHLGHNIRDFLSFIIDHYESLPETTIFASGNVFPRFVSEEYFQMVMNNEYFTPIEDYHRHTEKLIRKFPCTSVLKGFFSSDGGFCELNDSSFLGRSNPTKYFHTYNDFLRFCFEHPLIPRYNRFAPGANYIVPKANLQKLPRVFYENLKHFISHSPDAIPGESYIVERALFTLFTANFPINHSMLKPFDEHTFVPIQKKPSQLSLPRRVIRKIRYESRELKRKINNELRQFQQKRSWLSPDAILAYRKNIKVYDVFTFFNELDLLELRLEILDPYVDYFVIIEATETFSGKNKELCFEANKERFKRWEKKIIYHVTSDTPKDRDELRRRQVEDPKLTELDKQIIKDALTSDNIAPGAIHWFKEFYQKESIKKALVNLRDDDVCFVGDIDEIWDPKTVIDFSKDDIFKLKQVVYSYFVNNRSNEPWAGTLVTKYKNIKENCLNHLRTPRKTTYTYIDNGGWHFTNMGGADAIRKKLESYGHQEYNTDDIKKDMEKKIMENKDFIGRKFKFHVNEKGLPDFLLRNKNKYKHLFK